MKSFPGKIAVIGVGLIGGSIALGLKKQFGAKITVFGLCANPKRTKSAVEAGIIDAGLSEIGDLPSDINLIILAVPVRTSLEIIKILAKRNFDSCLVIDVGSTKQAIIVKARKLFGQNISFIGTHPMAGNETSGFESASAGLFRHKPWIICHDKSKADSRQLATVKNMIQTLEAEIFMMDAKTHDKFAGWVSHAQLALSSILINTLMRQNKGRQMMKIASNGFRDVTRGASHNPQMRTDIILTNKANIISVLGKVKAEIDIFLESLRKSDGRGILKYFQDAKKIRDNWLSAGFS